MKSGNLPRPFKETKIVAILKPGKEGNLPEHYRPIALLSIPYKLLERLLYNRISTKSFQSLPIEQAGFRPDRSCCDQVLALTTHIEKGFQDRKKTVAVFVDLTSAYDTIWREGMLLKFLKVIPCRTLATLLNNMLSNRFFEVHLNGQISKRYRLNGGLPQGSVLAPLLFNIYTADLPITKSRKFIYADDIALTYQSTSFEESENNLTEDLAKLDEYFKTWHLRPNILKTEVSCHHLNNKQANYRPLVQFRGQFLKYNPQPKYLGVILDRSLTFKDHLSRTAAKMSTRNNIIHKVAGTGWGADASVLRTSALALVYSVGEYCSPVWINSAHTNKIDTQLNDTMRMVSGTVKSTPLQWLPVLSNIPPPPLRRKAALKREWQKCCNNTRLPVHQDHSNRPTQRLRSRKPAWKLGETLIQDDFQMDAAWKDEWKESNPDSLNLITDPTAQPAGFNLPRRLWSSLNRVRTNHGRCAYMKHKWGLSERPDCDCGHPAQTIQHIVSDCPLRKFDGTIRDLHGANQNAVTWLSNLDIQL